MAKRKKKKRISPAKPAEGAGPGIQFADGSEAAPGAPEPEPAQTRKSAPEGPILLRTDGLVKQFKRRTVVNDVSLEVRPGEVVGLLGNNGAGKTTIFGMVVGLLKPTRGRIEFGGKDVTKLPMYRRAREGMAYLPQEPCVFRNLTARQNLIAILEYQRISNAARNERADALLEELDITHVAGAKAYTLSGGERRRVEIARALAASPKLFLLDEPFAGIDPIAVADLQQTVTSLKNKGIGVLITDHNVRDILDVIDRAYIIHDGMMLMEGAPSDILGNEDVRRVYLGDRFRL